MKKQIKSKTGWAIVCPCCEVGDILLDSKMSMFVIFDTKEHALKALENMMPATTKATPKHKPSPIATSQQVVEVVINSK